ncbi:MAG TPA: hypothetical protein VMR34_01820 [Candidatus Saccharimonadales bacterium]|nr:hypothetical protein [Candidatus Saccharimonadales bacterium]
MDKLSRKRIKELQEKINADIKLPQKPSEKPVKLNTSFENAVKQLGRKPSKKK